jgi:hypothetical protein
LAAGASFKEAVSSAESGSSRPRNSASFSGTWRASTSSGSGGVNLVLWGIEPAK